MSFNRARFLRVMSLFAVLDLCILLTGCGNWESQASSIISLLGPAIQSVIAILAAFGIGVPPTVMTTFETWATKAQNALITVKGLIANYQAAEATAQPGILFDIQTALNVVASDLGQILPELNITNPDTQAKVVAAFSAISGFIAAIVALLPAIKPQMTASEEHELAGKANLAAKDLRTNFNSAVSSFGKQYEI